MKNILLRLLAPCLFVFASAAQAAITCNVSSPGVTTAYDPASVLTDVTQSFFTVTCTRGSSADPTTVNWSVRANNGLSPSGSSNRAQRPAGGRITYDLYRESNCATRFQNANTIAGTMTFASTGTLSQQGNYWMCIAAGQGVAAGTYSDTVTLTLTYNSATATGFLGVTIVSPPSCTIPAAPGNIVLNYTAFGGVVNASTTFQVNCTATQAYTMALDATSGTLVGLNYTLGLSTTTSTGTGGNQTHTITGSIAAGQSGNCASGTCSASALRTLTITY